MTCSVRQKCPKRELICILVVALITRLFFFNGPFGSDDLVYLTRSIEIAEGEWTSADYNGALRYGYNIPAGFFIYLFGLNVFTANAWPLLCSLIEIAAVFLFARRFIGPKAARLSALFLAFMPLHVAVATRLHADPVVSAFLTLSFVSFYAAERTSSKMLYLTTGVLLGCVYWTKELVAVTFFAFLFYPLMIKKIKADWRYLAYGGIMMLLAHFAFMYCLAGDPLHAMKTVLGQLRQGFIGASQGEDSAWYYFKYLFLDIKHTWLAPVIALFSLRFVNGGRANSETGAIRFCLFWLASLLAVLSFFPVSLAPLKFTMKQSNYITLFLAPVALLAGAVAARLPEKASYCLALVVVFGGFVLAGFEQLAYQVFTANSRGLLAFSERYPGSDMYASANNERIACIQLILKDGNCAANPVHGYREAPPVSENSGGKSVLPVFAVIDRENLGWANSDVKLSRAPSCWREAATLTPAQMGNGRFILDVVLTATAFLSQNLTSRLEALKKPKTAEIYRADLDDFWCGQTH